MSTDIEQNKDIDHKKDIEYRPVVQVTDTGAIVQNPTYNYSIASEQWQGYLSKQFPTIGNPSPLGLCAFGLSCFVLSMFNAGGLVCKSPFLQIFLCSFALFIC